MTQQYSSRNEIFGGSPDGGASMVKAQLGIDIPAESVPIPSGGKVYPQGSSLYLKESLLLRPMTTREEDILTSRALAKSNTLLQTLVKNCLVDPGINVGELIGADLNTIVMAIRIMSYGPEYETVVQCPSCNHKEKHSFMLDSLPMKRLEINPVSPGANLFEFKLPKSGITVGFKYLSMTEESEMVQEAEARKKKLRILTDNTISARLKKCIVTVDGKQDRILVSNFVDNMPVLDSRALRDYMQENEPGIEMKDEVTCSECESTETITIPLGVSFFFPGGK